MGRSRAAIIARLVRIGEYPDRDAVRAADRERGGMMKLLMSVDRFRTLHEKAATHLLLRLLIQLRMHSEV
jgi:hypothetical protein